MAKLEYTIVVDTNTKAANLAAKVNDMIAKGWIPQGGAVALGDSRKVQLLQAMVRECAIERYEDNYVF